MAHAGAMPVDGCFAPAAITPAGAQCLRLEVAAAAARGLVSNFGRAATVAAGPVFRHHESAPADFGAVDPSVTENT